MTPEGTQGTQPNDPLVSVVIPTHNREATITRALDSVLRQSTTRLEVLVIDDASIDATVEKIETIADPRVKLISLPNRSGANAARNQGVRSSTAEWIAFQDSDDEWLPFKLETHLAKAVESGADIIWSPVLTSANDPRTVPYPHDSGPILSSLCSGNFISLQATLISRAAFEAVGGLDERLPQYQDWDLWLKLASAGFSFVEDARPSVRLYLSGDSLTTNRSFYGFAMNSLLKNHASTYRDFPGAELKHRSRLVRYHISNHAPIYAIKHLVHCLKAVIAPLNKYFRSANRGAKAPASDKEG